MADKKLLERLEFLHLDMEKVIDYLEQYGRPDKAAELEGAAKIVAEWIEEIKKEGVK